LGEADEQRVAQAQALARRRRAPPRQLAHHQDGRGAAQAEGRGARALEQGVHLLAHEEAHDGHGDGGEDDEERLAQLSAARAAQELQEVAAVDDEHRHEGADVQGDVGPEARVLEA
jgi:hypothetical protein